MFIAFVCLACVAFANGANDLSRATATLIGGRVTLYRKAVYWTVAWTVAGSLLSGVLARGVAMRFAQALETSGLATIGPMIAVALAAFLWIAIGSRQGLPISTTHALLGGIVGLVWIQRGLGFVIGGTLHLVRGFVLPMMLSPVLAILLLLIVRWPLSRWRACSLRRINQMHWISSGLVALCRGINDSAKIWALMIPLSALMKCGEPATSRVGLVTVTVSMALGGLYGGKRVALTMAHRITKMDLHESLSVNASTALILIAASLFGLPVASSHVLGGAVLGTAMGKDKAVSMGLAAQMTIAWTVTLPAAALLAALCWFSLALHLQWLLIPLAIMTGYLSLLKAAPCGSGSSKHQEDLHQRLVIFVCNGNTSRSPMAMWICRAEFARRLGIPLSSLEQKGIRILSAGLEEGMGKPMTAEAVVTLAARGITPEPHLSQGLTEEMALEAAAIYCMTTEQRDAVAARFPFAASKTLRLDHHQDLPNPGGKNQVVYERVASQMQAALLHQFATTLA